MNPEEVVKDSADRLANADLVNYSGPGRIITSWEKLDQLHAEKKFEPTIALQTKIPGLDEHIRDCRGGQLIVPSGDEGEGKTLLARTLTNNFSEQEARCLWFSYEERPDEFLSKFGDSVPYFLLPAELEMNTITWISERVKEAKLKHGTIHAIFIDHLHYLTDEVETGNLSNDLGRICRKLKLLAVNENLIVVLIVHTNRSEASEEPTIRSLRDSGMIGKEADTVIFIWRLDGGDDAVLKVAKCRATGAKNKKVYVTKIGPFLRERATEPEPRQMHQEKLKSKRKSHDRP